MKIILFLLALNCLTRADVNVNTTYDVIVVGGGVAGLSACAQLAQSGFKNILLLEASNRLGGRINTIQYGKLLDQK